MYVYPMPNDKPNPIFQIYCWVTFRFKIRASNSLLGFIPWNIKYIYVGFEKRVVLEIDGACTFSMNVYVFVYVCVVCDVQSMLSISTDRFRSGMQNISTSGRYAIASFNVNYELAIIAQCWHPGVCLCMYWFSMLVCVCIVGLMYVHFGADGDFDSTQNVYESCQYECRMLVHVYVCVRNRSI